MVRDPYRYFRVEAREIVEGIGRGVLELEKVSTDQELVRRLLRLAHTLKGAARVVKQPKIAELAHALEDGLAAERESGGPVPRERIDALLRLLDGITAGVASLDAVEQPERTGASRPPDDSFDSVRVAIGEVEGIVQGIAETGVQLNALHRHLEPLAEIRLLADVLCEQTNARRGGNNGTGAGGGRVSSLAEDLRTRIERLERGLTTQAEQLATEVAQVHDAANRLRLLPASVLFAFLERGARDAAQLVERRITFDAAGGETRLHAHVLAALRDALLHAVRNAVAHGVEAESERVAAGKPAVGCVELRVEQRGQRVTFACRDDGRGIDVDAIRRAAVRRGLRTPDEAAALGLDDAVRLLLTEGLTTTGAVTEVAGRGVGLDVVRETAARLGGEVRVSSQPGRGTTVEIAVPVSLSSQAALVIEAAGTVASLPLAAIVRAVHVADPDLAHASGGAAIVCEGRVVPFLPVARVLQPRAPIVGERRGWSAVIVRSGSRLAAVGVDRMLGTATLAVRPLSSLAEADPIVAGAALDAAGDPQLVLDPHALVAAAYTGSHAPLEPQATTARRVLVIDDSLTTRMLEQAILESVGYDVDLATSAEEGLARARERTYDLFLVDVEMPGMDGFEFVTRTRADPAFRDIPAILVTSRASPEDRSRGAQAGARAYIVKSEFNQTHLLDTIRGLVG